MDQKDIEELIAQSNHILDLMVRYESGESYDTLKIGPEMAKLSAPLLNGNELTPEIRSEVRAIDQHQLRNSAVKLKNPSWFSADSCRAMYETHVLAVKTALERIPSNVALPTKKTGSWKIFYSWQSTLPNATNRGLIRDSLEQAAKTLNKETALEDSHRIDSDTSDRPGSPKIFDTILDKIRECDVFVADVSLVVNGGGNRQSNSNVMVELGYALSILGEDAIVMVANTAYGEIRDLPFDLGFSRAIAYSFKLGQGDKAEVRSGLTRQLKTAIDAICRPKTAS